MSKSAFVKIRNRIESGDPGIYSELLGQYGPAVVRKLVKKAGCSAPEAEEAFVDAVLQLRDQVLQQRVMFISNLKEYLALASWEILRKRRKMSREEMTAEEKIKQAFFELSQKKYSRQEQLEVVRSPESHYSRLLSLTRNVIERLPEEGRKVLRLFYQQHRSLKQISAIMGLEGGEEEAGQLKSYYYIQWMSEVENELQYHG